MVWSDRIREGEYTSPSGKSFKFEFTEELVREFEKKAPEKSIFNFNGSDTEDLGNRNIKLPLQIFFSGEDYDIIADQFWESLKEKGEGTLKHPRWGDLTVLPISVRQVENLVERAREATFSIAFEIVPPLSFPISNKEVEGSINNDLDSYSDSAANFFDSILNIVTLDDKNIVIGFFNSINAVLDSALKPLIEGTDAILTAFDTTLSTIESTIDELVEEPALLAQNYIRLTRLPARATNSIQAKIDGYNTVFNTIFDSNSPLNSNVNTYTKRQLKNHYASQDLIGFAVNGALIDSSLNANYSPEIDDLANLFNSTEDLANTNLIVFTKAEVLAIIDTLINRFNELIAFLDLREEELEDELLENRYSYSPEVYGLIKNALNNTTLLLLERSFTLSTEKRIILSTERTPIDLTYEFYKTIDLLDFFISSNSLTEDELFLIPRNREIIFYE